MGLGTWQNSKNSELQFCLQNKHRKNKLSANEVTKKKTAEWSFYEVSILHICILLGNLKLYKIMQAFFAKVLNFHIREWPSLILQKNTKYVHSENISRNLIIRVYYYCWQFVANFSARSNQSTVKIQN